MTRLLRLAEARAQLAVSRSTFYRLLEENELERVYVHASPRIIADSIEAYIQRLRTPQPRPNRGDEH